MRFFHARKNGAGIFPRCGKKFSTGWKKSVSSPGAVYLLIFAFAWLVRLGYLAEMSGHPSFRMPLVDAGEYHALAQAWAEGQRPLEKLSWQPWFYPLALAQLYELAGPSVWAAKLLQISVGALVCALVAALAFVLWPRPSVRWIAGLMAALYGPLIHYDGELLAEPWAALGLTAAALAAVHYRQKPRGSLAFALGALGAGMLFIRPPLVAAWLPLLLAAGAAWARKPSPPLRLALSDAALLVVGFGLAAAPFVQAVASATGTTRFLPVTGGLNFYIGNSARPADTLNIRPGCAWENLTLWPELHGARTADEKDAFYRRQAVQDIREHPGAFVRHLVEKARQFVCSREIPRNLDLYVFRDSSRLLRALVWKVRGFGFPFGLLIGLAALGLWARRPSAFVPLAAIAAYAAIIIGVHVCDRYRLPVVPLFIVLASFGVLALADAVRERRGQRLAAQAGAILLLGAATSLGGPFPAETLDYRAELHRLIAVTAYEQKDFDLSETSALQAVLENPREAQAWNQLGLIDVQRGRFEAAEERFRRATECDPACFPAWFNCGKAAARRGAIEEAIGYFREGLRQSPAYLPAWIELGDLLRNTGRPDEALACYRETLRLRPDFAPGLQRLAGAARLTAPTAP